MATTTSCGGPPRSSATKAPKQPYLITLKDNAPFAFAGLWEANRRCGEPIESCTIITTHANELMAPIHDRMPVIIPPDKYDLWLDTAVQEVERLTPLLVPYDPAAMKATPVSTAVNNPKHDSSECLNTTSQLL